MILLNNIQQVVKRAGMLFLASCIVSTFACNKTVNDTLQKDYPADGNGVHSQNRKVLYLILDGAEGHQMDTLRPDNISALLKTSVYTWIGMSGANQKDTVLPGAWTSMMTGVNTDKSKVELGFDTADLATYPSLTTRLKLMAPNMRTAGFSASALFDTHLLKDATVRKLSAGNDAAVTANVIENLKNDSAKLVIGQFHSIAEAGDAYGYTFRAPEYADAIAKVDGYIGQILAALKARPSYATEDWLVVIASNENGVIDKNNNGDSTSAYNDSRRNSFIIYNNSRFMTENIGRDGTPSTKGLSAYVDSTLLLTGVGSTGVNIKVDDPKKIYDFKQGDSITIAFKMKFVDNTIKGSDYFMNLVSTATGFYGSGNGWAFWRTANGLLLYISDNKGHYYNLDMSAKVNDNNWHTLSATLAWPQGGSKVHINLYFDGIIDISDRVVTLDNDLTAGRPLVIGHGEGPSVNNYTNFYITDVRYWTTVLPYDIIAQYNCKNEISTSSPYFPYLAANFRVNDGNNSKVIKDYSVNHQDGAIYDPSSLAAWESFNEVSNVVCPAPDKNFYKATPNGLDIPIQIYQWLGVIIDPSWHLEGQYWSDGYSDVQLPENY